MPPPRRSLVLTVDDRLRTSRISPTSPPPQQTAHTAPAPALARARPRRGPASGAQLPRRALWHRRDRRGPPARPALAMLRCGSRPPARLRPSPRLPPSQMSRPSERGRSQALRPCAGCSSSASSTCPAKRKLRCSARARGASAFFQPAQTGLPARLASCTCPPTTGHDGVPVGGCGSCARLALPASSLRAIACHYQRDTRDLARLDRHIDSLLRGESRHDQRVAARACVRDLSRQCPPAARARAPAPNQAVLLARADARVRTRSARYARLPARQTSLPQRKRCPVGQCLGAAAAAIAHHSRQRVAAVTARALLAPGEAHARGAHEPVLVQVHHHAGTLPRAAANARQPSSGSGCARAPPEPRSSAQPSRPRVVRARRATDLPPRSAVPSLRGVALEQLRRLVQTLAHKREQSSTTRSSPPVVR